MQAFSDPVTVYLMALRYTRALYVVGRRKIAPLRTGGLLRTRPRSGTYHFYLYSTGWRPVTRATRNHRSMRNNTQPQVPEERETAFGET